jgi:hypothetical protein
MHIHTLMLLVSLWAAKTAASAVAVATIKATWKAVSAWGSGFGQMLASPASLVLSFPEPSSSGHILRWIGLGLLVVGIVGAVVFVVRRGSRVPIPTAC